MKEIASVYHFSYNCRLVNFYRAIVCDLCRKILLFPILAVKILVLLTRTQERRHAYAL